MLKSMTGYGRATDVHHGMHCSLELRSVNSRFPEISVYLPRNLNFMEMPLREKIQGGGYRGKIVCSLQISGETAAFSRFTLNRPLLESYMNIGRVLKEEYKLPGEITVYNVMGRQDILILEENSRNEEELLQFVFRLLESAERGMQEMQDREGESVRVQFGTLLNSLDKRNQEISDNYSKRKLEYIERFRERIRLLLGENELQEDTLHREVAVLGDKLDISEELQRFNSHLQQFRIIMDSDSGAVGKKLNFLLQEMNREVTTMGNKANDADISYTVVEMKNEIEMIREQVQNLQ